MTMLMLSQLMVRAMFMLQDGVSAWVAVTVKYDSSGQEQWTVRYDGTGGVDDQAYAIAVDSLANIYVTGYSIISDSESDYTTIKYSQSPSATPTPTPTPTPSATPTPTPSATPCTGRCSPTPRPRPTPHPRP